MGQHPPLLSGKSLSSVPDDCMCPWDYSSVGQQAPRLSSPCPFALPSWRVPWASGLSSLNHFWRAVTAWTWILKWNGLAWLREWSQLGRSIYGGGAQILYDFNVPNVYPGLKTTGTWDYMGFRKQMDLNLLPVNYKVASHLCICFLNYRTGIILSTLQGYSQC